VRHVALAEAREDALMNGENGEMKLPREKKMVII
jgi:hypothetical protein